MISSAQGAPQPFAACPGSRLSKIEALYFDVDDTLTTRGVLRPEAYQALYGAADLGLDLVAVTGRSVAWGEMLLRFFPLAAVVAETGAICLYRKEEGPIGVLHSEPDAKKREENCIYRNNLAARVLSEVPRARLALDNWGRIYDTAFDLVEEGPPLVQEVVGAILQILEEGGLNWARSSVHINAWCGTFDKRQMVQRYVEEVTNQRWPQALEAMVYVGDSVNDGSMFEAVPISIGVANIKPHLPVLAKKGQLPAFWVEEKGGAGFAQVVERLTSARGV